MDLDNLRREYTLKGKRRKIKYFIGRYIHALVRIDINHEKIGNQNVYSIM